MPSTRIGLTLSRTTGLPGDSADIGNWGEPIGIASLFVEGTLIILSTDADACVRNQVLISLLQQANDPAVTATAGHDQNGAP